MNCDKLLKFKQVSERVDGDSTEFQGILVELLRIFAHNDTIKYELALIEKFLIMQSGATCLKIFGA